MVITCVLQGLSDPSNYHEFCRLLARLKSNYQLGELVMVENYPESIQLIAKFTVQSLQVCAESFNLLILKCFARIYAKISVPLYEIVQVSPTLQMNISCNKACQFILIFNLTNFIFATRNNLCL